jgi:hypothetical protein
MRQRLQRAGLAASGDADTVAQLVGDDARRQMHVLSKVLAVVPG